VVTLSSDNAALTVPGSVTVTGGATSATFTATGVTPATAQNATVTATANGVSRTAAATVQAQVRVSGVSCSPTSFTDAGTSNCTVTLNKAAATGGQAGRQSVTVTTAAAPTGSIQPAPIRNRYGFNCCIAVLLYLPQAVLLCGRQLIVPLHPVPAHAKPPQATQNDFTRLNGAGGDLSHPYPHRFAPKFCYNSP